MPLMLPKQRGVRREASDTGRLTATYGHLITASATPHSEGAISELIASTSFDSYWVNVFAHAVGANATITDMLLTIYVGANTAEQLLIPDLLVGWTNTLAVSNAGWGMTYGFPLRVPAGSRLSASCQAAVASDTVRCWVELLGGDSIPHWTGTGVEAVGVNAAASRGTLITPGTTSEGALTSLGTTAHDWGFVHAVDQGNSDATALQAEEHTDLGSSSSVVIPGLENWRSSITSGEVGFNVLPGRFCFLPAGTTLHARIQSTSAANNHSVVAYGVY